MPKNWIRAYEMQAGPAGGVGFKITDLKIEFSLSKTEDETNNNISLSIWNLNDEHKAMLEQKDCVVVLKAGYQESIKQIFVGYVTLCEGEKDGADYKTSLTIVDGRKECRDTQMSKSYSGQPNSKTLIDDIASEMNITVSYGDDVKHIDFPNGYAFIGPATESLDKICASAGLSWSIQDGTLQIKKDRGTMHMMAYRLSSDTGLIGIPKKIRQSSENTTDNNELGYEVEYFMNADIKINDYVFLDTEKVKGYFRVSELSMSGSNWDGDWLCKAKLLEKKAEASAASSAASSATKKMKATTTSEAAFRARQERAERQFHGG